MDSDTLQESIHINLILLHNKGHEIDFSEGMFKEPNVTGFENVGYALAQVISPEEAKKDIPWPLLEDKILKNEFRQKFCKFIKTINTKYNANIPELPASTLQYPRGLQFLNFMHRLSTFTMELELKRMMSSDEKDELLERYDPHKSDEDLEVCTNICLGHRYQEEEKMQEHASYQEEASVTIKALEEANAFLEDVIKSNQAKLLSSVTDLDEDTKTRLMDVGSSEVMEDWNQRTAVKIDELKRANERLCHVSDVTSRVTQMIRQSADNQTESICLDGLNLKSTQSLAKFTNTPVRGNSGDVKLEAIFKAGLEAANRLSSSSSPQPSQLPWAQDLEAEVPALSERAKKCLAALNRMETKYETEIGELRPLLYESVKDRERPEWFACLRSIPLIPIQLSSKKNASNVKKVKKSRLSSVFKLMQEKKKKTVTVQTAFKLKRPSLHPFMTPSLKKHTPRGCSTALRGIPQPPATSGLPRVSTSVKNSRPSLCTVSKPSCKKSLYGKLPTGIKPTEEDDNLSDDSEFPPLATVPENVLLDIDQPGPSGQCKAVEKLPEERPRRRSLELVIERYKQLKAKQNESVAKALSSESESSKE